MDMVIERATILEWPQIEALQATYYARYPKLPWEVAASQDAIWWVCRVNERVLGCFGYFDHPGLRWITDFHTAEMSRIVRVKIAIAMRDKIHEMAKADHVALATIVRADNSEITRFLARRSKARPLSVILYSPEE